MKMSELQNFELCDISERLLWPHIRANITCKKIYGRNGQGRGVMKQRMMRVMQDQFFVDMWYTIVIKNLFWN